MSHSSHLYDSDHSDEMDHDTPIQPQPLTITKNSTVNDKFDDEEFSEDEFENVAPSKFSTTAQAAMDLANANRSSVADIRNRFEPGNTGNEPGFAQRGFGLSSAQNLAPSRASVRSSFYPDEQDERPMRDSDFPQGSRGPHGQFDDQLQEDDYDDQQADRHQHRPQSRHQDQYPEDEYSDYEDELTPTRDRSPSPLRPGSSDSLSRPRPPAPLSPTAAADRKDALDALEGHIPAPASPNDPYPPTRRSSRATINSDDGYEYDDYNDNQTPRASTNPTPTPARPQPQRAPSIRASSRSSSRASTMTLEDEVRAQAKARRESMASARSQAQPQRAPSVANSLNSRVSGMTLEDEVRAQAKARRESMASARPPPSRAPSVANSLNSRASGMTLEDEVRAQAKARRESMASTRPPPSRAPSVSSTRSRASGMTLEDEVRAQAKARRESMASTRPQSQRTPTPSIRSTASGMSIEDKVRADAAARREEEQRKREAANAVRRPAPPPPGSESGMSPEEQVRAAVEARGEKFEVRSPNMGHRRVSMIGKVSYSNTPSRSSSRSSRASLRDGDGDRYDTRAPPSPSVRSRPLSNINERAVEDQADDGTVTPRVSSPVRLSRYEFEQTQIPGTAHWNPSQAEVDQYSVTGSESDVHPALREGSYLTRSRSNLSQSKPESKATSRRTSVVSTNTVTPDSKQTNPASEESQRTCLTLDTLCAECEDVLADIDPAVPAKYLTCGKDVHPIIIHTFIKGTIDEAAKVTASFHERLARLLNVQNFPLHAAVRRAEHQSTPYAGHWYDITTGEGEASLTCRTERHYDRKTEKEPGGLKSLIYTPFSWAKRQGKKKDKHIQTTHVKLRDLVFLLDLPFPLEKSGPIHTKILTPGFFPSTVTLTKFYHVRGDLTLARLEWWEWTHGAHVAPATPLKKADGENPPPRRGTSHPHPRYRDRFRITMQTPAMNPRLYKKPAPGQPGEHPTHPSAAEYMHMTRRGELPTGTTYDQYRATFAQRYVEREAEITKARLGLPLSTDAEVPRAPGPAPPPAEAERPRPGPDRRKTYNPHHSERQVPPPAAGVPRQPSTSVSSVSSQRRTYHAPRHSSRPETRAERRPSEASSHSRSRTGERTNTRRPTERSLVDRDEQRERQGQRHRRSAETCITSEPDTEAGRR
ncbi:uncharacterized protein DSM5745_11216 [Aspergillus mulundensis]|uniref:Uncharacterized protein n=1 Tax=Aspergillus mulundensis TaxID=1810919 RepID=A0A3D8Q9K4_9EURO|nr:hypothetical protein DSM5745_11216 [Aspergillus mulundensis]RDW58525.1 hypothetical protein DSM5745_11216 [Aspergillus mulundensis]